MKIRNKSVAVFKIMNRQGFAALCASHLTEGRTKAQALARMVKALERSARKKK